jgi:hypothetical protein
MALRLSVARTTMYLHSSPRLSPTRPVKLSHNLSDNPLGRCHGHLTGGVRRSGRIKKQLGVLLLGTDTSGRVFSEETVTVVLCRHGAGVISTPRLAPDEILTIRLLSSNKEAEVRLVGQMGQETRGYTDGVKFMDPDLDFWQIEFPPPTSWPPDIDHALECSLCRTREVVHQSEIEADVYAISKGILRKCPSCGIATLWRRASSKSVSRLPESPIRSTTADESRSDSILHSPNAPALVLLRSSSKPSPKQLF